MYIHNRYRVIQELSHEGMGQVLRVADTWREDKQLTLKLIRADWLNEPTFRYEFAALCQLKHPNLITVYDFGFIPETQHYFYTMDSIEGETLRDYAARQRATHPNDFTWLYPVAVQLCRVLHYIHTRGLIHYDVRPTNILITPREQVKLMDFGLVGEARGATSLRIRGMPEYVAPEVIRGEAVDARADLYALGVTLYECVTGRLPFADDSRLTVLRHHLETQPPPPRHFTDAVPDGLQHIILKLLAKEPQQRYPHANAVVQAINAVSGLDFPLETSETRLGYVQSIFCVGRETELTSLQDCLARAVQGEPGFALITGVEGVGKSRLLRELRLRAQLQGFIVIEARPSAETQSPLGLWTAVIREVLRYQRLTPEESLRWYGPLLARLLPELETVTLPDLPPVLEDSRAALFRLLSRILTSLDWPLVILLDDVHEADTESCEFFTDLLTTLTYGRLLIALALRPADLPPGHPALAWMGDDAPRTLQHFPLTPFTRTQLSDFLRSMFGAVEDEEAWLDALYAASEGLPRRLELALHTLTDNDALSYDEGLGWHLAPVADAYLHVDYSAFFQENLARLDVQTRDLLRWAALLGMEPDIRLLTQVSGVYPDQLMIKLDHAVQAHFLWRTTREGLPVYHFTADWVRAWLIETWPAEARRAAHLRIAEKMERLYGALAAPDMLAWHYAQAGRAQRALELYRRAAQQAEQMRAFSAAARFYTAALEQCLAQSEPDAQTQWELLAARAAVWEALGEWEAQAQELQAMVDVLSRWPDAQREAWLLLRRARVEDALGRRPMALQGVRRARELAQAHALPDLEIEALIQEGRLLCLTDNYSESQDALERALTLAEERDARREQVEALRWLGETLRRQGNLTDAMGAYNRVLDMARWIGDLGFESDAYNALGVITDDLARKRDLYEASLELARHWRDQQRVTRAYNNLGLVYWRFGAYARARAYLEQAVALQRAHHLRASMVFSLESLARVCLAQGDLEMARSLAEEGLSLSRSLDTPLNEALYLMDMGLIALQQGAPEEAVAQLEQACAIMRDLGTLNYLTVAASKLAVARLHAGDEAGARAAADEALDALERGGISSSFPVQDIWWERYLVLAGLDADARTAPPEAQAALRQACELLLGSAAALSDMGLRRAYFYRVPVHQAILNAWRRWQGRLPTELRSFSTDINLRDERLQRLLTLNATLGERHDEDALLDFILEQTLELTGAERAFVLLLRSDVIPDVQIVRAHAPDGREPDKALVATILQSRAPLLITDVKRDERFARRESLMATGVRSVLGVPLLLQDELLGVLYVDGSEELLSFTVQDLDVLRRFAQQAARALHTTRMLRDVNARMHDLEVLRQVGLALTSNPSLDDVLNALLDATARLFPDMRNAHVFLYQNDRLTFGASLWSDGTRGRLAAPPRHHGLTYTVARQGQMLTINSTRHHPLFMDLEDDWNGAIVGLPLKMGARVVGVLNISFHQPRTFSPHDLRILGLLADQTAVAIESARLFEEVEQRARQLAALNAVSRDITSTLDLPRVLERIAAHARNLMTADECEIYLLDADKKWLRPIVALGPFAEAVKRRPIRVGEGLVGYVAQSGISEVVEDTSRDPRVIRIPGTPDAHALMCVALHAHDELLGVMALTRAPEHGPFSAGALEFMTNLARQAAVAIENARLYWNERARREEVAQALEEQRRLEQVKDQFIQNVSHELRTPLSLVHGYAELMRSGALGPLTPEQEDALEVIQRRTDFLTEMVTDFTLLIEIRARGLRAELLDVPPLLHEAVASVQSAIEAAQLKLETHIPPRLPKIRGEGIYLRRVLDNLFSNAIKFTPAGGRVGLRAWREDKHVCIAVSDTGIGIPEAERERIFQRFYQVDGGTTRQRGGTGLGLSVVKEIIEAHGGSVRLESSEGRGSVFTLRLPIAE